MKYLDPHDMSASWRISCAGIVGVRNSNPRAEDLDTEFAPYYPLSRLSVSTIQYRVRSEG